MMKRIILAAGIVLIALMANAQSGDSQSPFASETNIGALQSAAAEAFQAGDYQRMELALQRAVELRPFLAHLRLELAKSLALQDKKTEAFTALLALQKQGLSFDIADDEAFTNLRGLGVFDYIQKNMDTFRQPYGQPQTVTDLPAEYSLVEAMAYDAESQRTFFADARQGRIFVADSEGEVSVFAESTKREPLFSIFDLELDAQRGVLWALSTVSSYLENPDGRFAGRTFVVRYDLASGKRTGTFRTREKTRLIDMAVSPRNGTLFAVNGATPTIWMLPADRLDKSSESLEVLLNLAGLGAIRTITIDDAGETLYFSEYERGLFGHKLRENRSFTLHMGDQLNTAGIDSMGWYDDSLVLLQNGYSPHRVLRLKLGNEGMSARHAQSILSNLDSFLAPTTMEVVDDQVLVITNSHRNLFDPATGERIGDAPLEPHHIVRAGLNYGWMPPPVENPAAPTPSDSDAETETGSP